MLSETNILQSLRSVIDPEIGHNIVDLGLIYKVTVKENSGVHILYTLTSPACPMGETIEKNIRDRLKIITGINTRDIVTELTFSPAWGPERMTEELRMEMGFSGV